MVIRKIQRASSYKKDSESILLNERFGEHSVIRKIQRALGYKKDTESIGL